MSSMPIADLSYRNYDGPLESPTHRWWVIAKQVMRIAFKKKSLWVLTFLSATYYLMMMAITFFTEQTAKSVAPAVGPAGMAQPDPLTQFMKNIVWKDQFLHGVSYGQLWFFLMALLIGIGTIANDNRANALLVYLSKPCEKKDYILGKWMGVFLTMLVTMSIPSAFFFLYGALSYRNWGFLSADPWLGPKLIVLLPLLSAFYASLTIGISSLFNQGRLAGAAFAAIFFLTNFFTKAMQIAWFITSNDGRTPPKMLEYLFYGSIDGLEIGLAKSILNTAGSAPFGVLVRGVREVPAPPIWFALGVMALLSALFLLIAWNRVRAVEVVR